MEPEHTLTRIPELVNAEVFYDSAYVVDHLTLYKELQSSIDWQQGEVFRGKERRLTRLFVENTTRSYHYAGREVYGVAFPKCVLELKLRVEKLLGVQFDTCLANYYEDGTRMIGWHSDSEKDLVPNAPIASISLGATRHFYMRCKEWATTKHADYHIDLVSGSLFVMGRGCQKQYVHQVPQQMKVKEGRINLTFRVTTNV